MTAVVKEVGCRLSGDVQGVGLRAFISQKAEELGILGYVRNCSDGSVFVLAQGTAEELNNFLAFIKTGPSAVRIDSIETKWRDRREVAFGDFSIKESEQPMPPPGPDLNDFTEENKNTEPNP